MEEMPSLLFEDYAYFLENSRTRMSVAVGRILERTMGSYDVLPSRNLTRERLL